MRANSNQLQSLSTQTRQDSLPYWVFLGILILTVLFYLFPPDVQQIYSPGRLPPGSPTRPALFVYPVDLLEADASCSNKCTIKVCVRWIPGPSSECPRPGPGGGCCTDYEDQCDPECTDPDENQPPTISSSQTCSQIGTGGWCLGTLTLNLSASDPQGQTLLISGDVDGTPFACANGAASCSVPLPDGNGVSNFLVTSATGLTANGSQSYQRDSTAPQINGMLSGTSGDNGWYVSAVNASASASDAVSGVTSFSYSLDGGAWTTYSSALSLSEGEHTLEFQASDAASNQSQTSQTIKVDTLTPMLDLSLTGTIGSNGWYISNVQIAASADDSGSGLERLEYALDSGAWTDYSGPLTLTEGAHSLSVRARDAAGNETQTDQSIDVDTVTPLINLSVTGTTGSGGWYVSDIQVSASGSDAGSGLASFEYSLDDGGTWTTYTSPLSYDDGQRSLKFRAADAAGNVTTTPAQTYGVDTTAPVIDLPDAWNLGQSIEYIVSDDESGVASVRIVIEDDAERFPKVSWYGEAEGEIAWDGRFKDGTRAPDGEYFATIKALDRAGNESTETAVITVENNLFTLFLPPFNPPIGSPLPAGEGEGGVLSESKHEGEVPVTSFGGEDNDNVSIPVTGLFSAGGVTTVSGASGTLSFGTVNPNPSPIANVPNSDILWGAAAAAAIGTFTVEILRKKQEQEAAEAQAAERAAKRKGKKDNNPLTFKQIAQVYQASLNNFKAGLIKQGLSPDQANALKTQAIKDGKIPSVAGVLAAQARRDAEAEQRALAKEAIIEAETRVDMASPADVTSAAGLGTAAKPQAGKGKGLAAPALEDPGPPTIIEKLVDGLGKLLDWLFGGEKQSLPVALPTARAQVTHAPTVTPTPMATQTPFSTLVPVLQTAYITSANVNFRTDPNASHGDSNVISKLACGTSLQLTGETEADDEYIWQKVTVGDQTGWVVENFIDKQNQVCPNFAAKYAKYPGAGELIQITRLPFDYPNPVSLPSWWGFGNTTFARDNPNFYDRTTGLHPGLDWGIPARTPLIWNGDISGEVVEDGSSHKYGYLTDRYIVIESGGFHFIYGHISGSEVVDGQIVQPGEMIGHSGTPSEGEAHLHFEIRPSPSPDEIKSRFVINPITFFTPDLQNQWVPLFDGDYYILGDDPLSLGYYMNVPVQK